MLKTYQKLVKLNLDDLALYLAVEGGLFLLIQIIIGCVMRFARPDTSITVACILFPIVGGFTALVAGVAHVGISFEQALRFGQTRKRALALTLGLCAFQSAFALVLGGLLAAAERFLCVPLWAKLAGMNGWAMGNIMPLPEGTMVNGELISGKVLLIETFTLDWYWWLLIFVAAVAGATIVGAVVQRFGGKGGWFIWGICMAPMILGQLLPWEKFQITNWLIPLMAVIFVGGFLWSVWSLLHATVRV
mgnify:CR=1 FL=1